MCETSTCGPSRLSALSVIMVAHKPVKLCSHPPLLDSSVLYLERGLSAVSHPPSPIFQVLVWHTRTEKPHLANEPKHRKDAVVVEV